MASGTLGGFSQRLRNLLRAAKKYLLEGPASSTNHEVTLKTYRYVRVIIIAMTIGLLTSVVVEIRRARGCALGSLSAYYYTPARGLFTAGLIGIGICLVALRDVDDFKDALLNFAGMFGPMVALIPMDLKETDSQADCIKGGNHVVGTDPFQLVTTGREDVISNNFRSLTFLLTCGLVFLGALILVGKTGLGGAEPVLRRTGYPG